MTQTTAEAGRTRGPWIADDHQIFDQDGNRVAVFNGHATPDDEDEYLRWKADAANAAMAVNSHTDLVKALEVARNWMLCDNEFGDPEDFKLDLASVDAALAAAKGDGK